MTTLNVLATREYRRPDGEPVTLTIGRPTVIPGGDDDSRFGCKLIIEGMASGTMDVRVSGIDELQAIVSTLHVARSMLGNQGLTFRGEPGIWY